MSTDTGVRTRTPREIGYLPWVLHRLSALALVVLLAIHLGVQLYSQYGFSIVYSWGIYGGLLDVTFGLVLLHGVLGVRATVIETSASARTKSLAIWGLAAVAFALFAYRLFG